MVRTITIASAIALAGGVGAGVSWAYGSTILLVLCGILALAAVGVTIWRIGANDAAVVGANHAARSTPSTHAPARPTAQKSATTATAARSTERPVGA